MYFEMWNNNGPAASRLYGEDWRWHLKSDNHEILAQGEGYTEKANCLKVINLLRSTNTSTPIKVKG